MTDYLHEKRSKVCYAYWVNNWKDPVENWLTGGVDITIAGVPFCGLKGTGTKITEI